MAAIVEWLPTAAERHRQRKEWRLAPAERPAERPVERAGLTERLRQRLPWRLRAELDLPAAEPELATVLERLRLR